MGLALVMARTEAGTKKVWQAPERQAHGFQEEEQEALGEAVAAPDPELSH